MNPLRLSLLAVLCLFGTPISAQEIKVDGPTQANPGTLVILKATLEPTESAVWIPIEPWSLDNFICNSTFVFAMPKHDTVVLVLAQQVKDGIILTRQIRWIIKIKTIVDPPDIPIGDPLTTHFRTWTKANSVGLPRREALANSFAGMIPKAKDFTSEVAYSQAIKDANRLVLGEDKNAWTNFSAGLQNQFNEKAVTLATVTKALQGVVEGLK